MIVAITIWLFFGTISYLCISLIYYNTPSDITKIESPEDIFAPMLYVLCGPVLIIGILLIYTMAAVSNLLRSITKYIISKLKTNVNS